MKNLTFTLITALFTLLSFNASACRCAEKDSLTAERVQEAGAIFAGEVIRVDQDKDTYTETIHIKITKAIKNVKKGDVIQVKTSMSSASCGVQTSVGQVWYMHVQGGTDTYRVNMCNRKIMLSFDCAAVGTDYEDMERKQLKERQAKYKNDLKFISKNS